MTRALIVLHSRFKQGHDVIQQLFGSIVQYLMKTLKGDWKNSKEYYFCKPLPATQVYIDFPYHCFRYRDIVF